MKKINQFLTTGCLFAGLVFSAEKVQAQKKPLLGLGVDNTALSLGANFLNLYGSANTALGFYAGYNNGNSFNTFVGDSAGYNNTKGRYNTYLGYASGLSNKSFSNQIYLGDSAGAAAPIAVKFAGALMPYYSSNYHAGTLGDVLTSQGTGGAPQWQSIGSLILNDTIGGSGTTNVIATATSGWAIKGNSGTIAGTNYLGTNDASALEFKVDGQKAGWIDYSSPYNTTLGFESLYSITTGVGNTTNGFKALYANTGGSSNSALGRYAGYNSTGSFNSFVGDSAGYNNTTGKYNTYIGYQSGISNKSLSNQIYLGDSTGTAAPTAVKFAGALQPYYSSNYQAGSLGQVLTSQGAGAAPQWAASINYLNDTVGGSGTNNVIATATSAWSVKGNAGTSPAINFLGTTDTATLIFKVNGYRAGWIDAGLGRIGYQNTFLGYQAGINSTNGTYNTGIGYQALYSDTHGYGNIAIGDQALYSNTTGFYNVALGYQSLYSNTTGFYNTASGFLALSHNTTGFGNTATGLDALTSNGSGSNNTATGDGALGSNTIGLFNTATGVNALYSNISGSCNTVAGYNAGYNNTGSFNTFVGDSAGIHNTAGKYNIYIGYQSGISNKSLSNQIYLGDSIGLAVPTAVKFAGALEPYYSANYQAGAAGQVLTSQGAGVAPQWVAPGAVSGSYWSLSGNAGTSPATNFLGTTDTATLVFQVNGYQAGWIDAGLSALHYNNTFLGYQSGQNIITGNNNTGIGSNALFLNNTGIDNTVIGANAFQYNQSGSGNTVMGHAAGVIGGNESRNVLIGDSAGWDNPGNDNTYVGYEASRSSSFVSPSNSTGIGYRAHVSASNQVVLGNTSVTALVFNGDLEPGLGNNGTSGQVLTSQGAGVSPQWVTPSAASATSWSLTGNSGTVVGTNYLGTNDGQALELEVNAQQAGWIDYTAPYNTTYGLNAGNYEGTGYYNTSNGNDALYYNSAGSSNTALGSNAGYNNNSSFNTFVGDSAGYNNVDGTYNTYVGYSAGLPFGAFSTVSNTSCLGYNSGVAATSGNNSIYLGNNSIGNIYCEVQSISAYSDRRIKDNVQENVPGLAFINKLKPVTYNLNIHKQNELLGIKADKNWDGKYDIEKVTQSGFIAQDVEAAAQSIGYDFNGLDKPKTADGLYALGYTDFVVPLVKAVQELNAKNDSLNTTIDSLRSKCKSNDNLHTSFDSLRNAFKNIQSCLSKLCVSNNHAEQNGETGNNTNANVQDISLSSANAPVLYQNIPNPFNGNTKINYYLPEGSAGATIVFYDNYGNQIKQVQLSQTGTGVLNISPENLSNGIYSYSLIVNSNVIDTKRMVLQK